MPSSGFQTCARSEEHTSELQSHDNLACRLLLEKKRRQDSVPADVQSGPEYRPRAIRAAQVPSASAPLASPLGYRPTAASGIGWVCFFLKEGATTDISPFSLPAVLPI